MPPTSRIKNNPILKNTRRKLRSNGTPAEGAMWNILKGRKVSGLRFRRQFSVGSFVLDFYCPSIRLAVELDGDYHYHCNMPEKDFERGRKLLGEHGITTIRFENKVVFENPEGIVATIEAKARELTPSALRATPPIPGGTGGEPTGGGEQLPQERPPSPQAPPLRQGRWPQAGGV
jgi:very-short-patch-repair endonuclease